MSPNIKEEKVLTTTSEPLLGDVLDLIGPGEDEINSCDRELIARYLNNFIVINPNQSIVISAMSTLLSEAWVTINSACTTILLLLNKLLYLPTIDNIIPLINNLTTTLDRVSRARSERQSTTEHSSVFINAYNNLCDYIRNI